MSPNAFLNSNKKAASTDIVFFEIVQSLFVRFDRRFAYINMFVYTIYSQLASLLFSM